MTRHYFNCAREVSSCGFGMLVNVQDKITYTFPTPDLMALYHMYNLK